MESKSKSNDFNLATAEIKEVEPSLYKAGKFVDASWQLNQSGLESKVVFSGLGADEVFGGYARFKTAYLRGGVAEMQKEMSLDLNRLWHRNFGRDDRVLTVCGKEARFPFLDTNLLQFMRDKCPTSRLCDWQDFRGKGDKRMLRLLAEKELGLRISCGFEKRAIQFGTRIAKQTNVLKFGSNRKANGKAQYH